MTRVLSLQEPGFFKTGVGVWLVCFVSHQLLFPLWLWSLKDDTDKLGITEGLSTWQVLIPVVYYYGLWRLSKALEEASDNYFRAGYTFLLLGCSFGLGAGIMQMRFNKYARLNQTAQP